VESGRVAIQTPHLENAIPGNRRFEMARKARDKLKIAKKRWQLSIFCGNLKKNQGQLPDVYTFHLTRVAEWKSVPEIGRG
jgi:hypothetical protein